MRAPPIQAPRKASFKGVEGERTIYDPHARVEVSLSGAGSSAEKGTVV